MRLITASHITTWAEHEKRDCQGTLPLLMRRLVLATAASVSTIDFPGGDGVSDEGWDGRLVCVSNSPHLPDGASGWEMGTDRSASGKAEDDYVKRSGSPLDLDPAVATYVFVTPRSWPKRHAWVREKRAEGRWKDVWVVAAGEIEQWLEGAPAVALWLARHLRIAPSAAFDGLEGWWASWAARTRPATTADMLLGGRGWEVATVRAWIEGAAGLLEVQGDVPDEAIAFLLAASTQWPDAARDRLLARCVVATTEEAFRAAADWGQPLVIAAIADAALSDAGLALSRGHHVYLGVGRDLARRGAGVMRLPRLDRFALRKALLHAGIRPEDAGGVAEGCGRSIAVLRRRRSVTASVRRPPWASGRRGRALVPALLAGAWSDIVRWTELGPLTTAPTSLLDRAVLSGLAGGADYADVVAPMTPAVSSDDAPLRRAGDVWRLTSPLDAWYLLGEHVGQDDLVAMGRAAAAVFIERDPRYDLPEDRQWMASVFGKDRPHSDWLRQGLATSLAVVAHHGDGIGLTAPDGTCGRSIEFVVERVFAGFAAWQDMASIDGVVPLLAEAAPEAVLSALETFVVEHPDETRSLLSDGGGNAVTGHCRHAGALWALERLAWHPAYLERCLVLLARLDVLDPGGRWGNRPFASLAGILLRPSDPHTYADPAACLLAVEAVIREAPGTAWRLFLRSAEGVGFRTLHDPPVYLPAKPERWMSWTGEDRAGFQEALRSRLRDLVETGGVDRVLEILPRLEFLPGEIQHAVVTRLGLPDPTMAALHRVATWNAVRGALHRLRSRRGGRPLAEGVEAALESLHDRLAPSDPFGRVEWLFQKGQPQLAESRAPDWREYERTVQARRSDAARSLLASMEASALTTWASALPAAAAFGAALADATDVAQDAALTDAMLALPTADLGGVPPLLDGYARRKYADLGSAWLDRWVAVALARALPAPALAALHCVLPETADTWRRLEAFGPEVENLYWRWAWAIPEAGAVAADHAHALERLLEVGRASTALMLVTRPDAPNLPGPLLVRLAKRLVNEVNDAGADAFLNLQWEVEQLFRQIDRAPGVDGDAVMALEWAYLELLVGTERGPRLLHAGLAANPSVFVSLIRIQFLRRDRAVEPDLGAATLEVRAARARQADELLSCWMSPLPGQASGDINAAALKEWVVEARRLCAEADRAAVGDLTIGRLLAQSPDDPGDGAWPHRAVRQVLGAMRAEDLDRGFHTGVMNGRGATSRGLLDGGALERAEAARYTEWAAMMRRDFPHAARLLRGIAEDYLGQAIRQDEQAAKNDLE
ncbi:hypothetical protein EAH89_15700 [Roseomonas nepalensis]|uniref:Uncharacterized protein n=1 Tax=Muricoccus nepalensis TaxID=1854500 RepID=A0A502FWA5_9PROT|nr:hypothetical protein [Roseomonas nepalensis]TPG53650.1 hypothetical protein EAH89_15700 [Roseomonas nepalensis]